MDCDVVVEAAVPVYDVQNADEAVRIAIAKTGSKLNPDLDYVEIDPATRHCDECGAEVDPAFVAADEALVQLDLEMDVYNVDGVEHAERIARKEMGQRLTDVPLKIKEITVLDEEAETTEAPEEDSDDMLPEVDELLDSS